MAQSSGLLDSCGRYHHRIEMVEALRIKKPFKETTFEARELCGAELCLQNSFTEELVPNGTKCEHQTLKKVTYMRSEVCSNPLKERKRPWD